MMFGQNERGQKVALLSLSPETITVTPIETLGTKLKTALIEAGAEGAVSMYVYVRIEEGDGADDQAN